MAVTIMYQAGDGSLFDDLQSAQEYDARQVEIQELAYRINRELRNLGDADRTEIATWIFHNFTPEEPTK